jgi:hypothetical protein
MRKYCLDTSGFSNPWIEIPEDIHINLWKYIYAVIESGELCWNKEIAEELESIPGNLGECLKKNNSKCCLEIGDGNWDWKKYLVHVNRITAVYRDFISENHNNRKNTIGLNDVSIVALAATLSLPVISMEKPNRSLESSKKMRIPDLCKAEKIQHMDFNEFLRANKIKV